MRFVRSMVRSLVQRSYYTTCLAFAVKAQLDRMQFALGSIGSSSGTLHSEFSLSESVDYIDAVFDDYRLYGKVERFHGRIAEIGPGDNVGVGMLLRLHGSDEVDLVDRFYSHRDPARQAAIYEALISRHPDMRSLFANATLEDEGTLQGLRRHYGQSAAAETFFTANRGYDFIVSRAVGEHLYDPILAMRGMVGALNPGGQLLHKIDLRDHGMFSENHHELKWLEVPDAVYHMMSAGTGLPNRVLIHRYRDLLESMGLEHALLVTRLAGGEDITPHLPYDEIDLAVRRRAEALVDEIRPRLAHSLRDVPSRDLAVSGIFLMARKTA